MEAGSSVDIKREAEMFKFPQLREKIKDSRKRKGLEETPVDTEPPKQYKVRDVFVIMNHRNNIRYVTCS